MKRLVVVILLIFCADCIYSQSLIDIYKKGTVKLIPDTEYAKSNDWEIALRVNPEVLYDDPKGDSKSLIMMPDGSVAVNHYNRNYFSVFDPNGAYIKDLYVTNSAGRKFLSNVTIRGVNKNLFYNRPDAMGNMNCFDFEGKHVKTLILKHSVKSIIPLSENKFVVTGWAIWKTKYRDFVAIIDFDTNQETIIWDHFADRHDRNEKRALYDYYYTFEKRGTAGFTSMPYTDRNGLGSPPQIALVKNKIIVAIPNTGEILIYTIDGKLLSKEKVNWNSNEISVNEQKEIQKNTIGKMRNAFSHYEKVGFSKEDIENARKTIISQLEEDLNKISTPISIPFFSSIIKDSDDNLLIFEIPKETGANKFNVWVYEDSGKFIGQCSFVCDEYNLSITPSKMVFYNGYIYSLQTLKSEGNPLRLVRFKLASIEE